MNLQEIKRKKNTNNIEIIKNKHLFKIIKVNIK